MMCLTILGVRNIMQFQISWLKKGKVGKYIPDLLRSEFLQKFSANKTTPSGH